MENPIFEVLIDNLFKILEFFAFEVSKCMCLNCFFYFFQKNKKLENEMLGKV